MCGFEEYGRAVLLLWGIFLENPVGGPGGSFIEEQSLVRKLLGRENCWAQPGDG